ncbi:sentrin-specific protease 7-like [Panonychus citri]|uniref:sentrin-specific protease 7-like n=1 Tax=Panonychus citri TaxID=50023 RepID=UPI002306E272|nr:sentrin-specific protease 7-like [Panonychus citri]
MSDFRLNLSSYYNSVYFGVHGFLCDQFCLISERIQFFQLSSSEGSRSNITIPLTHIHRAYFDYESDDYFSILVLEIVPESAIIIRETLKIDPKQSDYTEGTILVGVRLYDEKGDLEFLFEDSFSSFDSLIWRLEITPCRRVEEYLDFINNYSQRSSSTLRSNVSKPKSTSSIIEIDCDDPVENQCRLKGSTSTNDDLLFRYPPDGTERISIRQSDLSCLDEEQHVNETILGFYLKYIERNLTASDITQRSYIFSVFFYHKLTQRKRKAQTQDSKLLYDRCYKGVKTWTKNVNIFHKDFIIMPINKSGHWFLVIICYPRKVPSMNEILPNEIEKSPKRPCILFMDSAQIVNSELEFSEPIRHFLTKEWEYLQMSNKNFSKSVMPDIYLKVPKQINDFDSGFFVLQCIENFLINPDHLLDKVSKDPAINLEDWFSHRLVSAKRRTIERLIKQQRKAEEIKKNSLCETDDEISPSSSSSYSSADSEI